MSKRRIALLAVLGLVAVAGVFMAIAGALPVKPAVWSKSADAPQDKRWQAVAPGRVEPCAGQIKVGTAVAGLVDKVLVKVNDTVFAGEPLIHLADDELRARLAAAEVQADMRERARDEKSATGKAYNRRKAQDAVADAERTLDDAQAAVDRTAAAVRANGGSDADLTAARLALTRARDRLSTRQEELRKIETDVPLPTTPEGQLGIARADYDGARSALDKMTIRAPIDGTVLQINVKAGEMATPASPQPPLLLADLSALCVRAEVDERDLGSIKVKQAVSVRATAYPDREFDGSVSSIAPLVEPGRLAAPATRNQTDTDVVQVVVRLTASDQLAVGMKADVYFGFGQVVDR